MSKFFFIERENMPCIYDLSFCDEVPAIILRVHKDYVAHAPDFSKSPMVESLAEKLELGEFFGFGDDEGLGFNGAFKKILQDGQFFVYSIPIPRVRKPSWKICPLCGGDKKGFFGPCLRCRGRGRLTDACEECNGKKKDMWGEKCLYCDGIGIKIIYDAKPAYAISASFTVLLCAMSLRLGKAEATSCDLKQLLLVDTITEKRLHGASLEGTYSIPLTRWLAARKPYTEVEIMTQAMQNTWRQLFGRLEFFDRCSIWARVAYKNGWLNVNCPGNACGLHPADSWGPQLGEGYKFSCHNVDDPYQQLTLLAGLSALCGQVRAQG